ncbi:MAG: sigma-70 family RNA polymerase sigma factor [Proteobacteria bacterium]|nr:sigma-70 family RNA polymerase sigma factor [Pseudomonadota bacterium]
MPTASPPRPERDAFEHAALEHLDGLYGLALKLTRSGPDAEDLVQDTMVRALRFFERFEAGTNLRAWLFTVLTNTFYNRVRKERHDRSLASESAVGGHYDRFVSAATMAGRDTEQRLLDAVSARQLREALEALPEDFRLAVLLCDVHGFSYKEMAEILGCPIGTVMSRLYRGRQRLQQALHGLGVELGLLPLNPASVPEDAKALSPPADLQTFRRARRSEG